jgi:hypothetical protein
MCFVHLVKEYNGVRAFTEFLCQLASVLMTDVTWWGTDQLRDFVFFLPK